MAQVVEVLGEALDPLDHLFAVSVRKQLLAADALALQERQRLGQVPLHLSQRERRLPQVVVDEQHLVFELAPAVQRRVVADVERGDAVAQPAPGRAPSVGFERPACA